MLPKPGPRPGTGVPTKVSRSTGRCSGWKRTPGSRRGSVLFWQTSKVSGAAGAAGVCAKAGPPGRPEATSSTCCRLLSTLAEATLASSGRMCASPISTVERLPPSQVKTSSPFWL